MDKDIRQVVEVKYLHASISHAQAAPGSQQETFWQGAIEILEELMAEVDPTWARRLLDGGA